MCRQHIGQVVSTCGSRQFATWFLPVCLIVCLCNLCTRTLSLSCIRYRPGRDRYTNFRVRLLHSCATGRTFCFIFSNCGENWKWRCLFALFVCAVRRGDVVDREWIAFSCCVFFTVCPQTNHACDPTIIRWRHEQCGVCTLSAAA